MTLASVLAARERKEHYLRIICLDVGFRYNPRNLGLETP